MRRKHYLIGVTSLVISALLTSISQVFYANQVQSTHPFLFTCISFLLTASVFQLISAKQKETKQWSVVWKTVLQLNGASILAFMGFYYALKFIEPAIVSSLEMGLGPLFVLVIALFSQSKAPIPKKEWLIAFGTFFSCILLIVTIISGQTGITSQANSFMGILASILCGLGAVLSTIFSKKLSTYGWTSSMILAHRFYGIIILSFLFTYQSFFAYLSENLIWILLVTIFGVTIPIYLLQKGIQYCEPFIVMMSICFIPVFTFFFQLFDTRIQWSNTTLVGVLILFGLGIASMVNRQQTSK